MQNLKNVIRKMKIVDENGGNMDLGICGKFKEHKETGEKWMECLFPSIIKRFIVAESSFFCKSCVDQTKTLIIIY